MRIVLANALPFTITANVAEIKLPPAGAVLLYWTSALFHVQLSGSVSLPFIRLSLLRLCRSAPLATADVC